ncbi:MAG: cell wall-binding repeat-containing protein [Buchananella hordeovulneris]|nr:cell wall-binding repeat-containing protein [Buchananella hordeovulneris]
MNTRSISHSSRTWLRGALALATALSAAASLSLPASAAELPEPDPQEDGWAETDSPETLPLESFNAPRSFTGSIQRISGSNRYKTAEKLFYKGDWFNTFVVVNGDNYADALAATPFAAAVHGPLVLVNSKGIPPESREIMLHVKDQAKFDVYVVGGDNSVPPHIIREMKAMGFTVTQRFQGPDRYETARQLARATVRALQVWHQDVPYAIAVDGENFADALAAGPAAAAQNAVILLTQGTKVPRATRDALLELNLQVTTIGGKATTAFGSEALWSTVGPDRYETSVKAAARYIPNAKRVVVAGGESFADALAGGVLAASHGGSLVLSPKKDASAAVIAYLRSAPFSHIYVVGGEGSISKNAYWMMYDMVIQP